MGLSGSMVELSAMIYGLDCIGLVLGCFTVYYSIRSVIKLFGVKHLSQLIPT